MALTDIPTIKTIKERIVADVEAKINQTVPAFKLSLIRIFAGAFAVAFYLLYQTIAWVYKQIFPQTQSLEALKLEGESIGVYYTPAGYAKLTATVTGTAGFASSGQTFYGPNQVVYRVSATTAIPGAVPMDALTAGAIGNLTAGDVLNIASSVTGINSTATVIGMVLTAEDDEDIEDYRERVILRKRTKFIYGSPAGYALSGLETPNFIWVGPYADPLLPGNVNIYGRVSLNLATNGIPTGAQLLELQNYLRFDPDTGLEVRRPINDTIVCLPIVNNEFDIIISVQNVNLALKNDIAAAVSVKVQSYEPYLIGITQTRNDTLTNTDIAITGDTIAAPEGGKVVDVTLFDVTGNAYFNAYTFYGNVFGKVRNVTFIDVI